MANIRPQPYELSPPANLGPVRRIDVPRHLPNVNGSIDGVTLPEANAWLRIYSQLVPVEVKAYPDPKNPKVGRLRYIPLYLDSSKRITDVDAFIEDALSGDASDDPVENVREEQLEKIDKELKTHDQEIPVTAYSPHVLWALEKISVAEMVGGTVIGLRGKKFRKPLEYEPANFTYRPEVRFDEDGKPIAEVQVYQFDEEPVARGFLSAVASRRDHR